MSLNVLKQLKAFRYDLMLALITIILIIITWYFSNQHIEHMERKAPGLGMNTGPNIDSRLLIHPLS